MPNLLNETSGLMAFVRTAEAGSFSAAARTLDTTPSAVSKSVARLEKKIGSRLFLRSTRALTLTQDGQIFFERIAPLLRDLDSSDEAIGAGSPLAGRLRVSMPSELAPLLLPRLFTGFAADNPNLHLDIGLTDRFVDLIQAVTSRTRPIGDFDNDRMPNTETQAASITSQASVGRGFRTNGFWYRCADFQRLWHFPAV